MSLNDFVVFVSLTTATLVALDYLLPILLATLYLDSARDLVANSRQAQLSTRQEEGVRLRDDEVVNLGGPHRCSLYVTRPIAEPPLFDYDVIIEEDIPSDKRMEMLFPTTMRKTEYRDLVTEKRLYYLYSSWTMDMKVYAEEARDEKKAIF